MNMSKLTVVPEAFYPAEAFVQTPTHTYCERHTPPVFATIAVWAGIFALIAFLVW